MRKVVMRGILTIFLALALATPAMAENVLRWASQGDALTYDPHSANESPTIGASQQVYEPLVNRNPKYEMVPCLAESWRTLNATTWEFKLRKGVTFHDGTPFTAEDVAFTLKRVKGPTSDFRNYITTVSGTKVIDDHTIQILTSGPDPILLNELAFVFIMSKKWCETHHATEAQNFKAKEETYTVRHENGTGPFMLQLREPDIKTVLVKNPKWWNLKKYPHNIDKILYTPIANSATRVAALLSGEVDFLLDPPFQDLERLKKNPDIKVGQIAQNRSIFFGLDQASKELRSSNIKGKNPFKDKRVRQAMDLAIDINAIHRVIMRGLSQPANVITAPMVHGYPKDLDKRPPYNPAKAKELLAEAGYPDGFEVKLDCPNNRYNNDEKICQAVVGMLGKVGIKVNLDAQPKTLHFPKITNKKSDFYMLGWGVATVDSHYVFTYLTTKDGPWNGSGYTDPRVEELTKAMSVEMDQAKRDAMIAEVWKKLTDDVVYLPLHHQVIVWAMNKRLEMPMQPDDQPQFCWAHLK
jgi:peptide/nickel transport system substrate-binding protein